MTSDEIVAAVRELHRPVVDVYGDVPAVCYDCGDAAGKFRWPCSTALLVFTEAEIGASSTDGG